MKLNPIAIITATPNTNDTVLQLCNLLYLDFDTLLLVKTYEKAIIEVKKIKKQTKVKKPTELSIVHTTFINILKKLYHVFYFHLYFFTKKLTK